MTTRSPTPVETMSDLLFGLVTGSGLTWALMSLCRDNYWREFNARRRGSNPPPPGRKPAPPAGPPEQPLTAQLIRYWAWEQEQVRRAWLDDPIRFDEGQTQRGHGHGGPTTPKPPIKPQPHGGRQVGDLLKPQFSPPRKIREDFL